MGGTAQIPPLRNDARWLLPMSDALVSIIIPCRNAGPWLAAALDSALAQTWPHTEIIVVDDGSTDDSPAIARAYASRGVQTVGQEGRGASAARNHGLRRARGEFVQFLDADDLLSPEKIAAQMALLQTRPAETVASCAWGRFQSEPEEARFVDQAVFRDFAPLDFLLLAAGTADAMMHPSAWLSPRPILDTAGPWNETLSLNDDGEYFCRVLLRSRAIAFATAGRSYYRSGLPGSLSRRRNRAALQSQFSSLELIASHLLAREDSPRVRRALANQWQKFLYDFYPADSSLISGAERAITTFGGAPCRLRWAPGRLRLARLIGWRAVWRLKQLRRKP